MGGILFQNIENPTEEEIENEDNSISGIYYQSDWRLLSDDNKSELYNMPIKQIMEKFGVGESTAFAWKAKTKHLDS